jgi:hypothetical protein
VAKRVYTVKLIGIDSSTFPFTYRGYIEIDTAIKFLADGSIMSRAPYTKAQVDSIKITLSDTATLNMVLTAGNTSTLGFGVSGSSSIGTTSQDGTAILTLSSTTKGILFPRMTSVQRLAISTPAQGLTVFDLDYMMNFIYIGNNWYAQ